MKYYCIILFVSIQFFAYAQKRHYTLANAHSHNDYLQKDPLSSAINAGFGSIEADVFPVGTDLLVAHSAKEISPDRSLESLYLKPLKAILKTQTKELQLLIDIKSDTKSSMSLVLRQLRPLKRFLSSPGEKKQLKIVMTGKIPLPENYSDFPDYIFFDNDLKQNLTDEQWHRVGMVSVNFKTYSKWKGKGMPIAAELSVLEKAIREAHSKNKPFRFWGMPDNQESWKLQQFLKVDWIGTDHINQLSAFLTVRD